MNTSRKKANIVIYYNDNLQCRNLSDQDKWTLGNPHASIAPDISIDSPIVSRFHGWFEYDGNNWYYFEDERNRNGTFYNERKIQRSSSGVKLNHGDVLRVDSPNRNSADERGVLILFLEQSVGNAWKSIPLNGETCRIGRDSKACKIVIDKPYISACHAQITFDGSQYYLEDLHSMSGTYFKGKDIVGKTLLRERDCFYICDRYFIYSDGYLIYSGEANNSHRIRVQTQKEAEEKKVILSAEIKSKKVRDTLKSGRSIKELIRDINLEIEEGSLVALLGTAGAGKSTVMNCLNGMETNGVEGKISFKGVDLIKNFDQVRSLIGAVPQKKTFHPSFTPEEEFRFAARMRLPGDTDNRTINERVDSTLKLLKMEAVRKNKNSTLSGGEQTRVNVGIELVADRELLCLDEPDAGLSPDLKHELFEILRDLAHNQNKSILTIIHDVSEINLFDQIIIIAKANDNIGHLAFSGTPEEAKRFFECGDVRDVYSIVTKNPEKFIEKCRNSRR